MFNDENRLRGMTVEKRASNHDEHNGRFLEATKTRELTYRVVLTGDMEMSKGKQRDVEQLRN